MKRLTLILLLVASILGFAAGSLSFVFSARLSQYGQRNLTAKISTAETNPEKLSAVLAEYRELVKTYEEMQIQFAKSQASLGSAFIGIALLIALALVVSRQAFRTHPCPPK